MAAEKPQGGLEPALRIRDVYPESRTRISDPKTATKERGENNSLSYLFCSHKFHKTVFNLIFEMLKKKIWANFQRFIELFTQKIVTKLSKIWVWELGSGIREKPIPDPGSSGQKGTASGSATLLLISF
jgi:hypothetical protein